MKTVVVQNKMTLLYFKKQLPAILLSAAVFMFIITFALYPLASAAQSSNEAQTQFETQTETQAETKSGLESLAEINQENTFDVMSADAWMNRLSNTINQVSFEISYVVSSPRRETMPYVWRRARMENGDSAEQLSLLNGPGFEQIRINNKVSIFEPGFTPLSIRSDFIDGPIPNAFLNNPDLLKAGYEVLLMGRNRVSGRMAQQIRVISKDKSRYQYNLWLDEQTGLLLKLNMYDLQGELLEQMQVTQLSINDDVQQYFYNIQADQLPPVASTQATENQALPWTLEFVPIGMQKVTENLRRISLTGQPAEYMMVSDGLVDVSIYVMKASDANQEDIALTTDVTSIVSISDGRIQVTVVGEIPLETASKMASSIVLKSDRP